LYDPETGVLSDCNQAAVELMGAESKEQLLPALPRTFHCPFQADGCTADKKAEVTDIVQREKAHHFEWLIRRLDGKVIPE
jgi:PAS domain-containing protein